MLEYFLEKKIKDYDVSIIRKLLCDTCEIIRLVSEWWLMVLSVYRKLSLSLLLNFKISKTLQNYCKQLQFSEAFFLVTIIQIIKKKLRQFAWLIHMMDQPTGKRIPFTPTLPPSIQGIWLSVNVSGIEFSQWRQVEKETNDVLLVVVETQRWWW